MAEDEAELILSEVIDGQSKLQISALGSLRDSPISASLNVASVRIRYTSELGGGAEDADTLLTIVQEDGIEISAKLLTRVERGRFRIRRENELGELVQEEWAALKDRVRRRLASPIELEIDETKKLGLFDISMVGGAKLSARFWLAPELVDGIENIKDWILRAEAEAAIDFEYKNSSGQGLSLRGRFLANFIVRKVALADWVQAYFSFDLPNLSGFDLRLPKIRLPKLKFPAAPVDFENLPASIFSLPLPPIIEQLDFQWTPPGLQLEVKLVDRVLTVKTATAGTGTFKVNDQVFAVMSQVMLDHDGGTFKFAANLAITPQPIVVQNKSIDVAAVPFIVRLDGNTLTPTFTDLDLGGGQALKNANLSVTFESERIVISSKEDPAVFIAVTATIILTYDTGSGKTKAKFDKLAIIEPYPITLIDHTVEAIGELIRLIAAIPLPSAKIPGVDPSGVLTILKRIGELLVAAARWLAAEAGKAAEVLAGLAEAVFKALLQLLERLAGLGEHVFTHIALEVRLDPKTYGLRQVVVMPAADDSELTETLSLSAHALEFELHSKLRPALVVDLGPESWVGLVVQPQTGMTVSLSTDLWLDKETGPQQAMGTTDKTGSVGNKPKRLIQLTAVPSNESTGKTHDIIIAAIQRGRPKFLQTYSAAEAGERFDETLSFNGKAAVAIREIGRLRNAGVRYKNNVYPKDAMPVVELTLETNLKDRLLSMLTKADTSSGSGDSFFDKLKQKVEITSSEYDIDEKGGIRLALGITVHVDKDFAPTTTLAISASLRDLSMRITGGDKIFIEAVKDATYHPLGLDLAVTRKTPAPAQEPLQKYKQFYLDLSHGNESLGLADEAKALLSYGKVSTSGKGLQFEVPTFRIGRSGFDLEARILPEPVRLGGVDVPFRFTSGQLAIKGSQFGGGSLTGSGQLPQALVGEANATVALQLAAGPGGGVAIKGATARLDKSGDPIRCTSTRFDLTITELGFDFVYSGSYHFYFLLTGSAAFKPGGSEYASGLLKNFKDVTIRLDKAPLAADPRVLLKAISFQVKVDPPKKVPFFDIFDFELRGFGFHPSAPKFDGAPAMSVSGQVKFTKNADKISPNFEFHSLWIAGPKPGSSKPRIRFDGLTVGVKTGAVNVEATAIAVDSSLPDLFDPGVLPKDVTAQGFLASGKLDIQGWASMSGAMGFLEMRKEGNAPRHSFFIYGQAEKLAYPIDTPVGRIFLREFGFGFGYKYTLAGIAKAETATSPTELVKILDDVSKYQGNLNTFKSWQPTYDNDDITLALRGMFALSAASQQGEEYKPKAEADLPNPLLFDIIAAFRTDFTFLINLRAWLSVNYNDWTSAGLNESWKSAPTMRGYLYFSVPRKEFLGRFIADGKGHVGEHPKLPEQLVKAIKAVQFSATLYIRPGLFHAELGWPYELGFTLGEPGGKFYLDLKGGLIHRIEDFAVLNGIAFKAKGAVYLEGRVGGSSLGAAAVARANFAIEARVLSYLSLKDIGESFYYGYMRIDVTVGVSVEVWLSFKVFGKRITLSASFSLNLAVSIALEAVIGPKLLGGRADVSVGVRAFGRSLSVRIALSFNNDRLAIARAKVARFMEMGLAAEIPDKAQDGKRIEKNPKPEPPRSEIAGHGDKIIDEDIGQEPLPPEENENPLTGRPIGPTDFWAILYPTRAPILSGGKPADGEWYVMQLLPRDHTEMRSNARDKKLADAAVDVARDVERATFFASPMTPLNEQHFDAPGHRVIIENETILNEGFLGRIKANAKVEQITANHNLEQRMELDEVVAKSDEGPLQLGKLLQSLFAGTPDLKGYGGQLEEPHVRTVASPLIAIAADAKASATQLASVGRTRSNLDGDARREAEIEDARSAVISAVAETAGLLAAAGSDTAGMWPPRLSEIDARDFGLTFIVDGTALEELFDLSRHTQPEPPVAKFTILKSDVEKADQTGAVALFNPPERMFRKAQPKFTPVHTIDAQGIKLNWDLEPAWGASHGAYDDPEFHLKHYRIRRIIRGLEGEEYRADFLAKAGSAIRYAVDPTNGRTTVHFLRPDFQFVDNLRRQEDAAGGSSSEEIPEVLRKMLLGEATEREWSESRFRSIKADQINLLYEIVPVDNAGTSDFGQVHVVDGFALIKTVPVSPHEVTLQVSYAGMPSHLKLSGLARPEAPRLRFLVKPQVDLNKQGKPTWDEPVYMLRIAEQPIAPSGGYGADAVDEARRRPDEDAIERLGGRARDFFLKTKKANTATNSHMVAEYLETDKAGLVSQHLQHYTVEVFVRNGAGKLDPVPFVRLAEILDVANVPVSRRKGHRVFLARVAPDDFTRRGVWRTAGFNIAIAKSDPEETETSITALSSVVEVLEQPVHYEFKPLERRDMRAESGRLIVIHPAVTSSLEDIKFDSIRDANRRTATRLEWNANPASLRLTTQDNATLGEAGDGDRPDNRTAGGFDVFSVDPDALPGRMNDPKKKIAELENAARPMGRVALLPAELDGLEPSGFGDLGRIESAYPSETLRLTYASKMGAIGLRKAGWYSAAESTVVFPKPAIRRSVMPDPDEGLIAALLSGGKPEAIRVSIPAWLPQPDSTDISPLKGWEIGIGVLAPEGSPTGWDEYTAGDPAPARTAGTGSWVAMFTIDGGFDVAGLRRLLQNLRLQLSKNSEAAAYASEQDVLRARIGQPGLLSNVTIHIEALRYRAKNGPPIVVAAQEHSFDLMPALHPVIADAMAFIQYEGQRGLLSDAKGKIYRRYSVAPDDNPKVQSKEFISYLDEAPPERDPYGWGALRTFGLAAGFRLYDGDTGDYVRFKLREGLGERVRLAFQRALARYSDGGKRDNGQPFFDLLTQPWGNVKLAWFDGGDGEVTLEDGERVAEKALAVVQIALRPRPDRLRPVAAEENETPNRPVRYFAMVIPKEQPISDKPWHVQQLNSSFAKARYDVLTVARTVVSQKPVRLSKEAPVFDFYEPRPAISWSKTQKVIAIVRETSVVKEVSRYPDLEALCPNSEFHVPNNELWHEIVQPAVLQGLELQDGNPGEEFSFGKFERLSADDWGDALFRPARRGTEVNIHEALDRLAYYAGRRFAPLAYPLVDEEPSNMPDTETLQEKEVAGLRGEMASQIVTFWSRFLDHCAPAWGKPARTAGDRSDPAQTIDALPIFLSVGTVADPGHWRCAPSPAGTVSVTMVDADRRGARRKFAVRPYGRYEAWSSAAPRKISGDGTSYLDQTMPEGFQGALTGSVITAAGRAYFVDTTLPRTEPLERPVILSSVIYQPDKDKPGRMELVVAHGSDMVLAQANRRNAALLAPLDISVGFWREFAHMPWLTTLEKQFKLDVKPMDPIGSVDNETSIDKLTIDRGIAEQRLVSLRQRVPDAWLGSTMISAMSLPYFFRVHALVHATAGVVVSDQVATTFEEGFFELTWPHSLKSGEASGEQRRKLSAKHSLEVDRIENPSTDGSETEQPELTTVTFDIAALRFIDCMTLDDADTWFGKYGTLWTPAFKTVAHLPEPTVCYRIVTETCFTLEGGKEEVLARSPEIEVLPSVPKQPTDVPELYLLQQSGPRYAPKLDFNEPDLAGNRGPAFTAKLEAAGADAEKHSWRIKVKVQLVQEPAAAALAVKAGWIPALEEALATISTLPRQPKTKFAPAVAGMKSVAISWKAPPDAGDWAAAQAALAARPDCPEVLGILASLAANPPRVAGSVMLLISPGALAETAVSDALAVLNGGTAVTGVLDTLLLRRPPRNDELAAFPQDDVEARELRDKVYTLADTQLFGVGRRPAVLASKGDGVPLNDTFISRKGV